MEQPEDGHIHEGQGNSISFDGGSDLTCHCHLLPFPHIHPATSSNNTSDSIVTQSQVFQSASPVYNMNTYQDATSASQHPQSFEQFIHHANQHSELGNFAACNQLMSFSPQYNFPGATSLAPTQPPIPEEHSTSFDYHFQNFTTYGQESGQNFASSSSTTMPLSENATHRPHSSLVNVRSPSSLGPDQTTTLSSLQRTKRSSPPRADNNKRQCSICGTSESPEWRKGEDGVKSLCNACGLRYWRNASRARRKEEATRIAEEVAVNGGVVTLQVRKKLSQERERKRAKSTSVVVSPGQSSNIKAEEQSTLLRSTIPLPSSSNTIFAQIATPTMPPRRKSMFDDNQAIVEQTSYDNRALSNFLEFSLNESGLNLDAESLDFDSATQNALQPRLAEKED